MKPVTIAVSKRKKQTAKGTRIVWVARAIYADPISKKRVEETRHAATRAAAKEMALDLKQKVEQRLGAGVCRANWRRSRVYPGSTFTG